MATTITTYFSDTEPTLTSQIGSIKASTDRKKVDVTVTRDPDGEIDGFFSTTLHAYNGIVELSGLGRLIEERFREKGRVEDTIEVTMDGASISFPVLYCEYDLDMDFEYDKCFLSASGSSVVHRSSYFYLTHWGDGNREYVVKASGLTAEGNVATAERTFTKYTPMRYVAFNVDEIVNSVLSENENDRERITKVTCFAVSHGAMQKMFFLADDPEYLTFRYKNIFNAPECVDVVGTVTRKNKVDRDLAVCDGRALQYNRSISRTYEVKTAALTEDQTRELEQMIASHKVELFTGNADYRVLITDQTSEVDNDDESLTSIKFTFRFENWRPTLTERDMGHLLPVPSQIFSPEFTSEFA